MHPSFSRFLSSRGLPSQSLSFLAASTVALGSAFAVAPHAAAEESACPDVVVLAARGSDQDKDHGEYFGPQQYSEHSAPSNGYEGPNLAGLFHLVEKRHPGTMDRVFVLAMDDKAYPAEMDLPALAEDGENLNPIQTVQRLALIVGQHPLYELIPSVLFGFINSVQTGMANAPKVVQDYEASTGCAPKYLTAGYSQGAIITTSAEKSLPRLHAAITLGNPLSLPGDPNVIGSPARGGGLLELAPAHMRPESAVLPEGQRLNYCLRDDFACDLSVASASAALSTKASRHASYFTQAPTPADEKVADTFASWVESARIISTHD